MTTQKRALPKKTSCNWKKQCFQPSCWLSCFAFVLLVFKILSLINQHVYSVRSCCINKPFHNHRGNNISKTQYPKNIVWDFMLRKGQTFHCMKAGYLYFVYNIGKQMLICCHAAVQLWSYWPLSSERSSKLCCVLAQPSLPVKCHLLELLAPQAKCIHLNLYWNRGRELSN